MTYLPSIRQLQYLVALEKTRHFGKAAQACFVSQSTLSAGLRELESLLGVTLVERNRRAVRFTPLGLQVVDRAWRLLEEANGIAELARGAGRPLSGDLRLGVIPTIAPFLLPVLVPRIRNRWPDLRLFLREEQSGPACEALARGQIDCLLLALPYACGEIEHEVLFDDAIHIAFPPGEAPREAGPVRPDVVDEGRLLLLEDGHCLKDQALAACGRQAFRPDQSMLGTSLHTLIQMVASGLGSSFVPAMAIRAGILEGTGIEARPIDSPTAHRQIALAWRPSSPRADEYRMLARSLGEEGA